jgi:hypothetical protein
VPFGCPRAGQQIAYAALFPISNKSSYINVPTLFIEAGHMTAIARG